MSYVYELRLCNRLPSIFGTYADSAVPLQMQKNAASDECLHCLLAEICRPDIIKMKIYVSI